MLKTFVRFLAYVAATTALAILILWGVGRVASDRWLATQFIAWIPAWVALAVAIPMLVLWLSLALAAQYLETRRTIVPARVPASKRRPGRWPARLALVLAAVATFCMVHLEARWLNRLQVPKRATGLNLAFWNTDGAIDEQIIPQIMRTGPEIAILANTSRLPNLESMLSELGTKAAPASLVREERFLVASRFPITRWCAVSLELPAPEHRYFRWQQNIVDPGRALLVEIDAFPIFPRKLVVWVLDLPSDPNLSRWDVAMRVQHRLQHVSATAQVRQRDGTFAPEKLAGGFPLPDLVVGDLNIPRGSASLGLIAEGMTHAFDQAGWGLSGTFPRERPVVHIDHLFVGPDLQATRYRVHDGDSGRHRFISARVVSNLDPPAGGTNEPTTPDPAPAPAESPGAQ